MQKCSENAEDADVKELCGSAPPHPVRCPVYTLFLRKHPGVKVNFPAIRRYNVIG